MSEAAPVEFGTIAPHSRHGPHSCHPTAVIPVLARPRACPQGREEPVIRL